MALGFLYGVGGGSKKSNPVLFENGAYGDGISAIDCKFSTQASGFDSARYSITDGVIRLVGANGAGCNCKYLTLDLSNYIGKTVYFEYRFNNGGTQTTGWAITSSSKRVVFGVGTPYESGYNWHGAMGISDVTIPEYINTNSQLTDKTTRDPASPLLIISKIWIAD